VVPTAYTTYIMNAKVLRASPALFVASLSIALFGQGRDIEPGADRMAGDYKGFVLERAIPQPRSS
jgi:hypothetical protein